MVAATAVTVSALASGTPDEIAATDLQTALGSIYGKAVYAANTVGTVQGQAQWAADAVGFLHYHLKAIGAEIGYTVPDIP